MTRTRTVALVWGLLAVGFPVEGWNSSHEEAFDPGPTESCKVRADYYEPPAPLLVDACTTGYLKGGEDGIECGHLIAQDLRLAASRTRAIDVLGLAAFSWYRARHPEVGGENDSPPENVADLAVTGRAKFDDFRAHPPTLEQVRASLKRRLALVAPRHVPIEPDLQIAAAAATERAYKVAWALRGPSSYRQANRPSLGWIAVSAEHDAPHRPVNVPSTNYPERDLSVRVPIAGSKHLTVTTRYTVAFSGLTEPEQKFDGTRRRPRARWSFRTTHRWCCFSTGTARGSRSRTG